MKTFLLSLFATFFIVILLHFFWSRSLSDKYPDLLNEDILNDTIVNIILDGRASARITLNNRKLYTLPWAKNSQYQKELSLPQMIKIGDILIKKASSDTIILLQDKKRYTFVANKTI